MISVGRALMSECHGYLYDITDSQFICIYNTYPYIVSLLDQFVFPVFHYHIWIIERKLP